MEAEWFGTRMPIISWRASDVDDENELPTFDPLSVCESSTQHV